MDDVCSLLSEAQIAQLNLQQATLVNVKSSRAKDGFGSTADLEGTSCEVKIKKTEVTLTGKNVKTTETFDIIFFAKIQNKDEEDRIKLYLLEENKKNSAEAIPKEASYLPLEDGFCVNFSIEILQHATSWCAGLRMGGVLISSTPENFVSSGAYVPIKARLFFEELAKNLKEKTIR